ncbi:MAG: DMT family transporter [Bacteroidales bacterium]|nr:DMT family transporter [Bacteroidales bacterium]
MILLLLAFIWGSSFILMKIGLKSFNSYQAAALRIFFASSVIIPLAIKNIKKLKRSDLKSILFVGFIGSFFPAFLFTKAQTQIDSAMAGMLNSLTPVFTLIIGIIFLKNKTGWSQITGLCLGLLGALGLISNGADLSWGKINSYALLIVLATIFYASNVNIIKSKLTHLSGAQITSFSFMFLWPVSVTLLLTSDFQPALSHPGWPWHLAALACLGIIGTATAMLLMNSLIRYTTPIHAASVTYIIPIFAIFWGMLDSEKITSVNMIFMAVILLGVYLINKKTISLKTSVKQ